MDYPEIAIFTSRAEAEDLAAAIRPGIEFALDTGFDIAVADARQAFIKYMEKCGGAL